MKIRPLGDRLLVKRIEEEDKSKGGIIIPDSAKEKPQEGKVVAVGKGKMLEDGKSIESRGEMATPMGGEMKMRLVTIMETDDKMMMKAYMMLPGSDEEHLTMEIEYTRVGS